MKTQLDQMWASKLGLETYNEALFHELVMLMMKTSVDYTIFFRELSAIPDDIEPLKKSFYTVSNADSTEMDERWSAWLTKWKTLVSHSTISFPNKEPDEELSKQMKLVNPKYILREWFVVRAYKTAAERDYDLTRELQEVMTQPYAEQSKEVEGKFNKLKPLQLFEAGGTSHYSCSS